MSAERWEITIGCTIEWLCWLAIFVASFIAFRRSRLSLVAWLGAYSGASSLGRLLTVFAVWSPAGGGPRRLQAAWHLVTAGVGVGFTYRFLHLVLDPARAQHLQSGLEDAGDALDAQREVDGLPFAAAALGPTGDILAGNDKLVQVLGCSLADIRGFRWVRLLCGPDREKLRTVSNWVAFVNRDLPFLIESVSWLRPDDKKKVLIQVQGNKPKDGHLLCIITDITLAVELREAVRDDTH